MKQLLPLLLLITLCIQSNAQNTTTASTSGDQRIHTMLTSGRYFDGMSYRNGINAGDAFQIRFKDYDPAKKEYSGEIKWAGYGETDKIRGKVNGNKIAFYQYMRESSEMISVVIMNLESEDKISGTWEGKGRLEGKKGTLYFLLNNTAQTENKVAENKPAKNNPPAGTAKSTTISPSAANSFVGVYYGNGTGFQVATGTIELKAGGVYIRKNGNQVKTGRYTVKGNKVIFDGELRAWNNGEAEMNGNNMLFSWLMDGVVIQFLFRKA